MVKSLENLTSNFWNTAKKYISNLKYAIPLIPLLFVNSCKEPPTEVEISGLDLQAYVISDTSLSISWNKIKNADKYNLTIYSRQPIFERYGGGIQQIISLKKEDSTYEYKGNLPKNNFSVAIDAQKKDSTIARQITHLERDLNK